MRRYRMSGGGLGEYGIDYEDANTGEEIVDDLRLQNAVWLLESDVIQLLEELTLKIRDLANRK